MKTAPESERLTNEQKVEFYNANAGVYDEDMVTYSYGGAAQCAKTLHKYLQGWYTYFCGESICVWFTEVDAFTSFN